MFYLGNIYGVLADPNATRASISSPAKPPPFSAPRYAVWVNTLWFLSLVMSLSCALWATSLHQWARRYIRLTQPARCSPEKRARMRAFFANGVDKMRIPWAVEGLPTLLHLSLFLFFGGLGIFLFNVDQEVFIFVVSWIGLFSIVYGLITLLPLFRYDSPYNTPLSMPAWFLYARVQYVALKVLVFIISLIYIFIRLFAFIISKVLSFITSKRYWKQIDEYLEQIRGYLIWGYETWHSHSSGRMSGGVEKKARETVEEQSSEIDIRILGWTIRALGDDDSLEKFFEAVPGLLNSKLVKHLKRDFPETHLKTFWGTLSGFMSRTSSSNSVTESVKSRRVVICRDIISKIPCSTSFSYRLYLHPHFDQAPVSMERLQAMARWFTHKNYNVADHARVEVANRLARMKECDDDWIAAASDTCGIAAHDLRDNIAHLRENVLLATLIHVSRQLSRRGHSYEYKAAERVGILDKFDIRHTLPMLRRDFCTLWNELVQEAKKHENLSLYADILWRIRQYYIILHQGTDAAPTAFSAFTGDSPLGDNPSSYPLCDIASHRDSTAPIPDRAVSPPTRLLTQLADLSGDSPNQSSTTISQQAITISVPPLSCHLTTPGEIGDNFQVPATTSSALPAHTSPHPTDAPPPSALQDIPLAVMSSFPLEGTTPKDIFTPCAEPDTSEILLTPSTHTPTVMPTPVPETTSRALNQSSTSCDADAASASASDPLLSVASIVGLSVSASPPLPNTELLALLDGTSCLTGNTAHPHFRARGLVNTGSMCFANSVLQVLVRSPPLWNLFRQLGDLKGQRGGGPEPRSCATPLVDTMIRFIKEFMNKEEPPPMEQSLRQATGGNPREGEEVKKGPDVVDSFEPTYIYVAMKEKTQLKCLLVRSSSCSRIILANNTAVTDLC